MGGERSKQERAQTRCKFFIVTEEGEEEYVCFQQAVLAFIHYECKAEIKIEEQGSHRSLTSEEKKEANEIGKKDYYDKLRKVRSLWRKS